MLAYRDGLPVDTFIEVIQQYFEGVENRSFGNTRRWSLIVNRDFDIGRLPEQISEFGLVEMPLGTQRIRQEFFDDAAFEALIAGSEIFDASAQQQIGQQGSTFGEE